MEDLKTITAIVTYANGVDVYDVKGIKDTSVKIMACYLAQKLTKISERCIAKFFQINKDFMLQKIEDFSIELLLNFEAKQEVTDLERLFKMLQNAKVKN
ncbi:hypothetical protein [Mesonia aquimarina]|uniref:hypothetical protein n=1 Tax=Mesonia aquimarina TaxID=1504967 RepID=UPI000EF60B01|nr:hypothetical protein [Mesonia aquimarina]